MGTKREIIVGDIWMAKGQEVEVIQNEGHGIVGLIEVKDRTRTPLYKQEEDFRGYFQYARTLDKVE